MFISPNIPIRNLETFDRSIRHPNLWIWDAWTCSHDDQLHMYCLALAKTNAGRAIAPSARNQYQFHIRHFTSANDSTDWMDAGAFLLPPESSERNIWSGSVLPFGSGALVAYTDIRWPKPDTPFVQSICLGWSNSFDGYSGQPASVLSHPVRDHAQILDLGYFLADIDDIGSVNGEDGGPILAWRDPFLFEDEGKLHAIWCAKIAPSVPAIAHAEIVQNTDGGYEAYLQAPIELPDAQNFTQAELPKIWREECSGEWLLMVSACDRKHEHQPDSEVKKELRLYRSANVRGPWRAWSEHGSRLQTPPYAFGASPYFSKEDTSNPRFIVPLTEQAPSSDLLTMQSDVELDLREILDA